MTDAHALFHNIEFDYSSQVTETISENEIVLVFSNTKITKSEIPGYPVGMHVEQISVSIETHYENKDGSEATIREKYLPPYDGEMSLENLTFHYKKTDDIVYEKIDDIEYCVVYSDVTIDKTLNPKYKNGDGIEQITLSYKIYFENHDGSSVQPI